MDQESKGTGTPVSLGTLTQGVLDDIEKLIGQHFDMLRSEMKDGMREVQKATVSLGTGVGATALGGILGSLALVHLLHKAAGLPLWACYAAVGGTFSAAGAGLLATGARQAAEVTLFPRRTTETLKEEITGSPRQAAGFVG